MAIFPSIIRLARQTKKAGEYAEDLAASMLATTLGIEFNPENGLGRAGADL